MKVDCKPEEVIAMMLEEEILELPESFGADSDFFDAGLDSMGVMQLIVIIEERFGVALGASDANRDALGTPRRMAETINARR